MSTPLTDGTGPGSGQTDSNEAGTSPPSHAELYEQVVAAFGSAIARLARAYERDDDRRQDLLQDIHLALWRSLASYDGRCSLRTWVYRVAHNVAASHVLRDRRRGARSLVGLDALEARAYAVEGEHVAGTRINLDWLHEMVRQLKPIDRQLVLLYLEGMGMEEIAEIAGLSQTNTRTKLHRIRALLATRLNSGVEP